MDAPFSGFTMIYPLPPHKLMIQQKTNRFTSQLFVKLIILPRQHSVQNNADQRTDRKTA